MKPWERRLRDLSQLLNSCHSTYFDPDLFRMNTNQFLQTARTVTFIIQKNKAEIQNFQSWYSVAVTSPWGSDEVMTWAKDARNTIEKEGDLELNSLLNATLLFSYLEEQDVSIDCKREELLNAGIKKLIRLAQKKLPTGVSDAAAVKIERRWVTASLPSWELLHALGYVYARMFDCCQSLAQHLGVSLNSSIPNAGAFDVIREEARHVQYIKLNGLRAHSLTTETITFDKSATPPETLRIALDAIQALPTPPRSLADALDYFSKIAVITFEHFSNHVPMLFILNDRWEPIDRITTQFTDQADKFIFWRNVADRIRSLKAAGFVWISESWLRSNSPNGTVAVRNMPIVGERLHVLAIDSSGERQQVSWKILRPSDSGKPTLQLISDTDEIQNEYLPFFLVPALRAMGVPDPEYVTDLNLANSN